MIAMHSSEVPFNPGTAMSLDLIHRFSLGASLVGLQWGSCGVPLRAFTRDGRESVLDTSSGTLLRSTSFAEGPVSRVICRPRSDRSFFVTTQGVLNDSDDSVPPLEAVRDATWSPCGRFLSVLSGRGLTVWNADKRKLVTPPSRLEGFDLMAWNPTPADGFGQLAATVPSGVLLWSACGVTALRVGPCSAPTSGLAWHPAGRHLAVAYQSGSVEIWDQLTDQSVRLAGAVDPVRRLLWDHKGSFLIGVSLTSLCVWNAQAAMHCGHADAWAQREAPLTDVAQRGNGNLLAVGNIEGRLELRRLSSPSACLRSTEFASTVTHLAWSTSGRRLAVGIDGGQVCIVRVCR